MAIKSFNRTVEAINVLLDKLDGLPTYPMAYKGSINNPSYLPEEATEGDLYLVYYADTSNLQVINSLYYRKHNGQWSVIANISYTQAQIDEMFAAIGGGLHWKGAVSYYSNLPSDAELGDMWTVLYEGTTGTDPCGDEYAWGTLSGTEQWILIGKETYSKTQIDDMVDGLADEINTNKNNISLLETMNGAKNIVSISTIEKVSADDLTINVNNGIITITGTQHGNANIGIPVSLTAGRYYLSGCPTGGGNNTYRVDLRVTTGGNLYVDTADTGNGFAFTVDSTVTIYYNIRIASDYTVSSLHIKPMIITKAAYDAGYTDFCPYALSNAELTAKEQVNENNILFNCVTGVNNVVVTPNLVNKVVSGITYNANSDGTISVTAGTPSANSDIEIPLPAGLSGDYILSGCPSGGTSGNWKTQICLLPNKTNVGEIYEDTSITVTLEADKSYIWRWRKYNGSNVPALTIKPMLAPAGLGAQSYTKGVMSNAELTDNILSITPTITTVDHTATQTTDYEQVVGLTYTLAAGKTANFDVSAINQRGAIRGIKVATGTTLSDANTVAISETSANYRALTCGGIYTNTGSSDVTLYVFVKFYSAVKNAVTLSAYQV